ncbi:hypothetical protein GCM10023156_64440 [Novipirellula rosea]|uniref:Secreted protein n=2 Tax=Novipirellula rosea TaxID=1031540 RepID=A0ABP8NTB2_9BACT
MIWICVVRCRMVTSTYGCIQQTAVYRLFGYLPPFPSFFSMVIIMKQLTNLLRQVPVALLLTLVIVSFAGCGSSGNTVVESNEGAMTEQELEDYEQQINQQEQNYQDRYR